MKHPANSKTQVTFLDFDFLFGCPTRQICVWGFCD